MLSVLALLLLTVQSLRALDVGEVIWNFDGRVVPERFNLLSVRVSNPSPVAFDGQLRLTQGHGMGNVNGAAVVQPCFVSPFGSRWEQFEVYVDNATSWRLTWGLRKGESLDLPVPAFGPPARVLLADPEALRTAKSTFRLFSEDLFPPTVAALDGLHSVLLDHVPRWEVARRTAFLDWVRGGGCVHLLTDAQGQYPVFRDELALLNTSKPLMRVGAGTILRHKRTVSELNEEHLGRLGYGAPSLRNNTNDVMIWQMASSVLPALGQLAKPEHCWWMIGLLAALYVAAIGPGVFLLGLRRRDYRIALLALVGGVVLFSLLFGYVGRRGQGETGKINSLAFARAVGDGQYLVTQWIDLFVKHGDYYELRHAAPHNLYAVPQEFEQVNGEVSCGKDGRFLVDIPMFSQRGFLHQASLAGPRLAVSAEKWPENGDLNTAKLLVSGSFTTATQTIWAVYRNNIWTMALRSNRLEVITSKGSCDEFFSREKMSNLGNFTRYPFNEKQVSLEALARERAPAILAWGLASTRALSYAIIDPIRAEQLQVFVLTTSPPGFRLQGKPAVGRESGYVLYAFDVASPSGKEER